jgi:hypothetical protein
MVSRAEADRIEHQRAAGEIPQPAYLVQRRRLVEGADPDGNPSYRARYEYIAVKASPRAVPIARRADVATAAEAA